MLVGSDPVTDKLTHNGFITREVDINYFSDVGMEDIDSNPVADSTLDLMENDRLSVSLGRGRKK